MSSNPFLSKEVKLKRVWKGFVIAFPVVIMIFVLGNYYVNLINDTVRNDYIQEKEDVTIEVEKEERKQEVVLGVEEDEATTVIGIDEMKRRLSAIIPEKYDVIESDDNFPGIYDDGCVSIYELYPKDYSELEKKYLDYGYIHYCKNLHTASLVSQIGEIRYDEKEDSWLYYFDEEDTSGMIQEKKTFGTNIVSVSEVWGSHHSWETYIVRVDDSNEVIMILIPQATRIRCEEYDESGNEIWKEDCVEFLKSMNKPESGNDWVFNEFYDDDYKDLLEILKEI